MNRKKIISILSIIAVAILIFSVFVPETMAVISPSQIQGSDSSSDTQIASMGNKIVSVIKNIGIVVSVAVLVVLGIKYMMGSAEEKAEYKKTMLPYFIGALLVFSASGIVTVIQSINIT